MSQRLLSSFGLCLALCGSAAAQGTPLGGPNAERSTIEVTPQGAFLCRESSGAQVVSGTQQATAAGALWSHGSGALGWIGGAVSIGNRASQVFTEYDLNSEAAELFSVYDADPPSAIWSDGTPLGTEFRHVASSDADDTHVSIHQVVLNGNPATRQAVLRKYGSSSAVPDWSHTFAPIINAAARTGISRDGQTIVAAVMDNNTFQVLIWVFGPGSGTPLSSGSVTVGNNNFLRGFDLSADGSTLYFSAGVTAYVYDLASHTVAFSTNIGASFDSHAISGDGGVFAYGNFNALSVWEKSGATYLNTHTVSKAGQVYCAVVDISDDGSTVAAAWYFYATGLSVAVEALDVPSKTISMTQTVTGTGGFQNAVGDVSCSADGQRFAVGLWGDQGNVAAELRLYDRAQNAPLATLNTPGSVFSIDLSADGQRVVAGSKAVHANTQGNGGRIDLLDAGGEDFILRGSPSIGSTISIELHAPPAATAAALLVSKAEAVPPVVYAGIGTLYIDRTTLVISPLGPVTGGGVNTFPLSIASDPLLVGTSDYLQCLSLQPRTLSQDWVKLTYLP